MLRATPRKIPKDIPPPVDAVVRSLAAELTIAEDAVRLTAQFEVESLSSGWHAIPLLGGSAPLIGVQPADANVAWQEERYVILRKEPGIQSLTLEFAAPRQPGPPGKAAGADAPERHRSDPQGEPHSPGPDPGSEWQTGPVP